MSASTAQSFTDEEQRLAAGIKALAHPARLAIVRLLAEHEECICGEIVDDLPLAQSTVSQHLKALKEAGLVQGTVEGRRTCYCLDPDALAALEEDLSAFFDTLALSSFPSDCC
ncbi:MAG: ArsR/SmtB family transcription factor [Salinibacter sp.]